MTVSFAALGQTLTPVPMDSAIRYGKLPNGFTYYIRHNEKPKERCEFHLAQAVGAILEEDHQNGLAHFLEHMCFNGTEHFPGKGILNYFESQGVSFGSDINAYTSLDETVYRLSNVPTTREVLLDSALLVMYDWSCAVSLLGEEIDNERGVIREEWRTGRDAYERMWTNQMKIVVPGSQYAKRDVIGDTAIINNFSHQALRDYYNKWYGPDLQALVVVGDIDVDQMEQKIIKLFSTARPRAGLTPRTRYGALDNEQPNVGVYLDHEAQYQSIAIGYKYPAKSDEYKLSEECYIERIRERLFTTALNRRLSDLTDDPECNFTSMGVYYSNLCGETDALEISVEPKDGKELAAYNDMCREIERIRKYGITETDLELSKKSMLSSYETSFNKRNDRKSSGLARSCYRHFLNSTGFSVSSPYYNLQLAKRVIPDITADQLNEIYKPLFSDKNMYIVGIGKNKKDANGAGCDECDMPTKEQLLSIYNESKSWEVEAPKREKVDRPLVEKEPKPGVVKERKQNKDLDATELTLSNGIKVIIKTTDFKDDEILMLAQSYGGTALYPVSDISNAEHATSIVMKNGVGTFNSQELHKVLTGKNAWIYPYIGTYYEEMSGTTTVRDFETLLQLNYLYFTAPRTDDKMFETFKSEQISYLASRNSDPKTEWEDRITKAKYNNSDRIIIDDTSTIKALNQRRAIQIYKERFANPADFTFFFVGNIDANNPATIALIEKWLGSMKTTKKFETRQDDKVRFASGAHYEYFKRPMETKTASNEVLIIGHGYEDNKVDRMNAVLIGRILSTRYLESIREREGGSYGVGVWGYLTQFPKPTMVLDIDFDTDPDKQNRLLNIIYEEIETIIKDGPLAKDLANEKENMFNRYNQNLRENHYWLYTVLYDYYINHFNNLTDYLKVLDGVTAETIQQTLKRLYEQNNRVEVVMMPTR